MCCMQELSCKTQFWVNPPELQASPQPLFAMYCWVSWWWPLHPLFLQAHHGLCPLYPLFLHTHHGLGPECIVPEDDWAAAKCNKEIFQSITIKAYKLTYMLFLTLKYYQISKIVNTKRYYLGYWSVNLYGWWLHTPVSSATTSLLMAAAALVRTPALVFASTPHDHTASANSWVTRRVTWYCGVSASRWNSKPLQCNVDVMTPGGPWPSLPPYPRQPQQDFFFSDLFDGVLRNITSLTSPSLYFFHEFRCLSLLLISTETETDTTATIKSVITVTFPDIIFCENRLPVVGYYSRCRQTSEINSEAGLYRRKKV